MQKVKISLFHSTSHAPSRAVKAVLDMSGLYYTHIELNLMNKDNKCEEFKIVNPNQNVPTLIDGDKRLDDSIEILKYLCTKYVDKGLPDHLYPVNDKNMQAKVDEWLQWNQEEFAKNIREYVEAKIKETKTEQPMQHDQKKQMLEKIASNLQHLNT